MGFLDKIFGKKKSTDMDNKKGNMGDMAITCPNCSSPMGMKNVDGKMVILCNNCGHFFMDQAGFQNMVGKELHEHDSEDEEAVHCPSCNGKMKVAEVNEEKVDVCTKCGKIHTSREAMLHINEEEHEEIKPDEPKNIMGFVFKMDQQRNIYRANLGESIQNLMIGSLFVIHQDGLLITSYTKDKDGVDVDILGGMIVAITDFVKTSFESFRDNDNLSSIRFREKEIAFEHGKYLILAMELEGNLDAEARAAISNKLEEIEGRYDRVLAAWQGDMSDVESLISDFKDVLVPLKG